MTTESSHILSKKYFCTTCDYITCKKCNYDKHIMSRKHADNYNNNQKVAKGSYPCSICNKCFNDRAGLWRHKKKCTIQTFTPIQSTPISADDDKIQMNIILELVKQNQELLAY